MPNRIADPSPKTYDKHPSPFSTSSRPMLLPRCATAISPSNVLRGRARLWFIDPRGVNGEAAYDIAVLALKASCDNLDAARVLADPLARRSGIDPDRAAAWTTITDAATV